jgi:sugar-phosphatase
VRVPLPPLLLDLDGTVVDSRVVVLRHWRRFCDRHGLELAAVASVVHGVRTADAIAQVAPQLDAAAEAERFDAAEELDVDGLVPVPGAPELLASLAADRWGIVTSGHRTLAERRLRAVGLPVPAVLVTGDEVTRGKPHPEGYLAGAARLGADPAACVAVEDAPPGLAAARAAGMAVVAIAVTHDPADLTAGDAVIATLDELPGAVAGLAGGAGRGAGPTMAT